MHYHKCPKCKTVWMHGEESSGKEEFHTCPECGFCQHSDYRGNDNTFGRFNEDELTPAELASARQHGV